VYVIEQVYREAQFVEQQLAAIADCGERARTAYAQHLRMFGCWDAALDNNPDAPRWLCSYQLLRVLPRAYTGEMAGSMHFRHIASCQRMCILSPSRCVMDYVIKNPVNAGLVAEPKDWPYTYCVGRT
jgi:hypothetical protein